MKDTENPPGCLGRKLYEQEAKNWPSPVGWDKLSEASKQRWKEREQKDKSHE